MALGLALPLLGTALWSAGAPVFVPQEPEIEVPAFRTEKAAASYVLSLPERGLRDRALPLIVDFHGAIAPERKGAVVTRQRIWSAFVREVPAIVVGLNGRTRAWGTIRGEHDDVAYALFVAGEVQEAQSVDRERVYLAGFSSGSDFLCRGELQLRGRFAGSLVICPGPPNVVGLRGGELVQKRGHPFYFVTGEEDYIRKDGAWQAFLALDRLGGPVMYREVPRLGHSHPSVDECARALAYLELLARRSGDVSDVGGAGAVDDVAIARDAVERGDLLLASTHLQKLDAPVARELCAEIEALGRERLAEAERIDPEREPGRAFEAWWHLRTQFHRFTVLAERAQQELDALSKLDGRELHRARRAWFASRAGDSGRRGQEGQGEEPGAEQQREEPRGDGRSGAEPAAGSGLWTFDRYLSFDEVEEHLMDLARRFEARVRLSSIGRSIEGRELWVVEIGERAARDLAEKPAAFVQAGIHGNEVSSVMNALYFAWQMGANPDRRRSVDRLLRDVTLYVAPAANPDALQHFMTEPHSHWRPRYNYRPHDADGDGRTDEDGYEDLDGDGEIGQMYRPDPDGPFVLKDGRLARGTGAPRYSHVGREGIDDDGDGRYSEDPPGGVDLNRNFPVGFTARREFEGFRGALPLSEPETAAVVGFVRAHPNVSLFLDYHNHARCVFYWLGEGAADDQANDADIAWYGAFVARAEAALGYAPRPLEHAGAGLSIAWAYGELGVFSAIVELEPGRGRADEYLESAWGGTAFMPAKPFAHPQLGDILLGSDYRKLARRNPDPSDIRWQVERNWEFLRDELKGLPKLVLSGPRILPSGTGFVVEGEVSCDGALPLDSDRAGRLGMATPVRIRAEGAEVAGEAELEVPRGSERRRFRVVLADPGESVTLLVSHAKGGTVRLPVKRPRRESRPVRTDYDVEAGYRTTRDAQRADNAFFQAGIAAREAGPVFDLKHRKPALRIAVLLGEWRDLRHAVAREEFERAFFSDGDYTGRSSTGQEVYGSVRDFYREMSHGRIDVEGRVFDWVELPGERQDYEKASFGASLLRDRLEAAVLARDGGDALEGYDGIVFVWAGNPVARVSNLWPMRVPLKHRPDVIAFKMGELYRGQMVGIGVPCHELGHTFGVNDKYGLGVSANPLGPFCLMCRGTHGGGGSLEHRPFHLCAWCKMVIGWVEPCVIDPSAPQKLALRPSSCGPGECYRVLLRPDGSEYLLLENRRREGFSTELPSAGLFVLRVGPNDKPSAPQTRVQLLPAHGRAPAARADPAEPGAVAWPQPGRDELVVDGVRLGGIRLVDDVIYFEVSRR